MKVNKNECYTCGRTAEIADRRSGLRFCSTACAKEHNDGREKYRKEIHLRYSGKRIVKGRLV